MKVLVVTPWLPTAGRPETGIFVQRDIEMLREDHDVEVIHLSADGEMATVGFPVTTVRMSTTDPRSIRRAGAIIVERAARVDLVHSMAASALLPFLGHRVERPWVHTEHWSALLAPDTAPRAARASLPLVRAALRRPDVVVAVGNDLARAVQRTRRGPTVVIPNAVQRPTVVHPRPRTGGLTLVGVGGLIERKGPDIAVRMVAELRERGEDGPASVGRRRPDAGSAALGSRLSSGSPTTVAVGNDLARAVQRTRRGPTVVIPNAVQRPTVV
ncbi:hypothetical protein CTI14_21350, partial [Methylobacterium radiotolerans]